LIGKKIKRADKRIWSPYPKESGAKAWMDMIRSFIARERVGARAMVWSLSSVDKVWVPNR